MHFDFILTSSNLTLFPEYYDKVRTKAEDYKISELD